MKPTSWRRTSAYDNAFLLRIYSLDMRRFTDTEAGMVRELGMGLDLHYLHTMIRQGMEQVGRKSFGLLMIPCCIRFLRMYGFYGLYMIARFFSWIYLIRLTFGTIALDCVHAYIGVWAVLSLCLRGMSSSWGRVADPPAARVLLRTLYDVAFRRTPLSRFLAGICWMGGLLDRGGVALSCVLFRWAPMRSRTGAVMDGH